MHCIIESSGVVNHPQRPDKGTNDPTMNAERNNLHKVSSMENQKKEEKKWYHSNGIKEENGIVGSNNFLKRDPATND